MISFHGSSCKACLQLVAGSVDVGQGGGELGRGFYSGEHLHLAKAWALHRYGDRQKNVVQFDAPDNAVLALALTLLDRSQATQIRRQLKEMGTTRTHVFGADMVWSPIVGSEKVRGDQYKWESLGSEALLNGLGCSRIVV